MPKYMQLNTRSINTSQQSLISYARIKDIDKILLQEIYTPNDLKPLTAIFSSNPNIRLRRDDPNNTGTHGGVAIFTKPTIKSISNYININNHKIKIETKSALNNHIPFF